MTLPYEIRYETDETSPGRRSLRVWKGPALIIDLVDVPTSEAAETLGSYLLEYGRFGVVTRWPRKD